jgi:hypothetical protein
MFFANNARVLTIIPGNRRCNHFRGVGASMDRWLLTQAVLREPAAARSGNRATGLMLNLVAAPQHMWLST